MRKTDDEEKVYALDIMDMQSEHLQIESQKMQQQLQKSQACSLDTARKK